MKPDAGNDAAWTEKFDQLKRFHRENGHLSVPKNWPPDRNLAEWVSRQRTLHSQLSVDQIEKLLEVGISFGKHNTAWYQQYFALRDFVSKYRRFPQTNQAGAEEKRLLTWGHTQRQQRLKMPGALGTDLFAETPCWSPQYLPPSPPMRVARIKPPETFAQPAFFHCVSRIVNRDFVIKEQEKEFFVKWMRKYEAFCGVRVVTFCILDNHVHLLVEVPPAPPELELSDEHLLERLALVSKKSVIWETRQLLERYRKEGNEEETRLLRQKIRGRMYDVSSFMKQLKQRFSQWFNKKHGRCGTLWEDRFKSVLVEGAGMTLATMAAYIDLNPVRAKFVEDPKDYRWSGYGQAAAGKKEAVEGLGVIASFFGMEKCSRREVMERYRVWVYEEGAERKPDPMTGSKGRAGIKMEKVDATVERGGKLTRGELLRVRVRYFLDGAILGSRGFVEEMLEARREEIGLKRKTGATRMQGGDWGGLCTLRALRVGVLGERV